MNEYLEGLIKKFREMGLKEKDGYFYAAYDIYICFNLKLEIVYAKSGDFTLDYNFQEDLWKCIFNEYVPDLFDRSFCEHTKYDDYEEDIKNNDYLLDLLGVVYDEEANEDNPSFDGKNSNYYNEYYKIK